MKKRRVRTLLTLYKDELKIEKDFIDNWVVENNKDVLKKINEIKYEEADIKKKLTNFYSKTLSRCTIRFEIAHEKLLKTTSHYEVKCLSFNQYF